MQLEKDFLIAFGEGWTKKIMSKDSNIHLKCMQQFKNLMTFDTQQFF